jgi:hypothetical protein
MATYTVTIGPATDASRPVRREFAFTCIDDQDREAVVSALRRAGWDAPGWDQPGAQFQCVTTSTQIAESTRIAMRRVGVVCLHVDQDRFDNTPKAATLANVLLTGRAS